MSTAARTGIVVLFAAGCAARGAVAEPRTAATLAPVVATAPGFTARPPGPIAGRWRVTCPENEGEIIELTVADGKATGVVVVAGAAARYGFRAGEEIFRLRVDDGYGDWFGEVRYRGVGGQEHWDAIRFSASATELDATMTNEPCYRSMPRVR